MSMSMSTSTSTGRERVLVAMSGGVDSSVAAALLSDAGHDVVGVTMKLWGGESDTGCCSVADVDDARRSADRLGIDHHVFNLGREFDEHVVAPYVADHAAGRTPNPCVSCNRHLKFDVLLRRAEQLGFDAVATGHHARIVEGPGGRRRVARGADAAKDQSYVVGVLGAHQLARLRFPIGASTKDEVRAMATRLGLVTADKPDSQDVCFIRRREGRAGFLAARGLPGTPGRVVDRDGVEVGRVAAVELVTVGQRRGVGLPGGHAPRYVLDVDVAAATVVVGEEAELRTAVTEVTGFTWADRPVVAGRFAVQCSAHGAATAADVEVDAAADRGVVRWATPRRRVAPGQLAVLYDGDEVVGSAVVTG
jgi:tRNA-specific 2-thiouridylase